MIVGVNKVPGVPEPSIWIECSAGCFVIVPTPYVSLCSVITYGGRMVMWNDTCTSWLPECATHTYQVRTHTSLEENFGTSTGTRYLVPVATVAFQEKVYHWFEITGCTGTTIILPGRETPKFGTIRYQFKLQVFLVILLPKLLYNCHFLLKG